MASFEFLAIILTGLGLTASIFYYSTIIQNANKTRKSEVLWNLLHLRRQDDNMQKYADILNLQWDDYDDFMSKYWIDTNPEAWARMWSYLTEFNDTGLMVNQGLIDIKDFYEFVGLNLNPIWDKYQPIIEMRRKLGDPKTLVWFEYLIDELNKESKRKTITPYE